jgi:PEGA domain
MNRQGSKPSPIFSAALVVILLALCAGRADAQSAADKKRAQTLQVEGVQLLERGDNRGALQKFEEAIRIFPSPKIRFNIGRAHAAMGNDVDALNDFEGFLDEAPYAPKQSRDEAQRIIESLRPRLSYVEIATDDVGARVTVDGKEVGVAPLARPLAIAPGAHEVRLDKAQMIAETRSVSPVAGQKVRVSFKLHALAEPRLSVVAPPLAPASPSSPSPADATHPGAAHDRDRDAPPLRLREGEDAPVAGPASGSDLGSGSGRRALKWIAWGLAAGGAGLGTYGYLTNRSGVSDFNGGCAINKAGAVVVDGSTTRTVAQCERLKDQYESASKLAIGSFVGAGVLAATGFILWATESSAPDSRRAQVTCVPAVFPAGLRERERALAPSLSCAWRF